MLQQQWLTVPNLKNWVNSHGSLYLKVSSEHNLGRSIDLSSMEKRSLISHTQSKGHRETVEMKSGLTTQLFSKSEKINKKINEGRINLSHKQLKKIT